MSRINELGCQTSVRGSFDPQRFSGEVANRDRRRHLQQAAPVMSNQVIAKMNILEILPRYLFCFQPMRIVVSAVRQLVEMRQALAHMRIAQSPASSAARKP